METLEFRAMNTGVLLAAREGVRTAQGLQTVRAFIDQAEQRFSRFMPTSELCRLNTVAGEWVAVSWELMEMLELSLRYHELTRGLFDPSVLPDLIQAGYDRSMDAIKEAQSVDGARSLVSPQQQEGDMSLARRSRPAFSSIRLDAERRCVCLPAGMAIDLGGIAKGWIVQQAANLLSSFSTPCAVNAGGDMFFVGTPEDGSRWRVELEDPLDPNRTIAGLSAGPGAVVTSSVTKRVWNANSARNHHIIDPRTGRPAKTHLLSATVFARDAAAAEAYAKALLLGGAEEARRLQAGDAELAFVTVDEGGDLRGSPNCRELIHGNVSVQYYS